MRPEAITFTKDWILRVYSIRQMWLQSSTALSKPPDGEAHAGVHVRIDHGNGLVTRYAHLQTGSITASLTPGTAVSQGDVIGVVGNTANVGNTPPHLHFNVQLNGQNQNPEEFLNSPCPE